MIIRPATNEITLILLLSVGLIKEYDVKNQTKTCFQSFMLKSFY